MEKKIHQIHQYEPPVDEFNHLEENQFERRVHYVTCDIQVLVVTEKIHTQSMKHRFWRSWNYSDLLYRITWAVGNLERSWSWGTALPCQEETDASLHMSPYKDSSWSAPGIELDRKFLSHSLLGYRCLEEKLASVARDRELRSNLLCLLPEQTPTRKKQKSNKWMDKLSLSLSLCFYHSFLLFPTFMELITSWQMWCQCTGCNSQFPSSLPTVCIHAVFILKHTHITIYVPLKFSTCFMFIQQTC